jgi:hypothetical protein
MRAIVRAALAVAVIVPVVGIVPAPPVAAQRALNCDAELPDNPQSDDVHSVWFDQGPESFSFVCNYETAYGLAITVAYACPADTEETWQSITSGTRDNEVERTTTSLLLRDSDGPFVSQFSGDFWDSQDKEFLRIDDGTMATIVLLSNFADELDTPEFSADEAAAAATQLAQTNRPSSSELVCPKSCTPSGLVSDRQGHAVPGMHVRLEYGTTKRDVATNPFGQYTFGSVTPERGDRLRITLIGEEFAHQPQRFQLAYDGKLTGMRSDRFKLKAKEDCVRDFDVTRFPDEYEAIRPDKALWPDLVELYSDFTRAWALTDLLRIPMDYGLPIRVYTWCSGPLPSDRTCPEAAAYYGSNTLSPGSISRPFIAITEAFSLRSREGQPEVVYHEFGHAVMADSFDNTMPRSAGTLPHNGYFQNKKSTAAWTEGWAEFYAMMVSKYVDVSDTANQYRGRMNLELDYPPWIADGKGEEYSVAGLLLDFEDGARDYGGGTKQNISTRDVRVATARSGERYVLGTVAGNAQAAVTVRFRKGGREVGSATGVAVVKGTGDTRRFLIPAPAGLSFTDVDVSATVGQSGDDDPIDGNLSSLWATILNGRNLSGGHIANVYQLHNALLAAYAGDRDTNGIDDVDQIFISHGLFADVAGGRSNRRFDAAATGSERETPGLTSHYEHGSDPAIIPRFFGSRLPEQQVHVDTGGVAATALVQVSFPAPDESRSFGYLAELDPRGFVEVVAPPPGSGATVSVTMLAAGREPALAGVISADRFWRLAEAHPGEPFLRLSAVVRSASKGTSILAGGLFVAGIALGVAGVIVLLRRRRTSSA